MAPIIGITIGDVAGIGPEVIIKAISSCAWPSSLQFRVYSPDGVIEPLCARYRVTLKNTQVIRIGTVASDLVSSGRSDEQSGRLALECIKHAVQDNVNGNINALVTAPIHKAAIRKVDPAFIGHTELLAQMTKTDQPTMFMIGKRLRVGLVTTHIALRDVAASLNRTGIFITIKHVCQALQKMGIASPRVAVMSLNPHGSLDAEADQEEKEYIGPAIREAAAQFQGVEGPFASDVVFYRALKGQYDALIAMYHDQALGAFKMVEFDDGVNMTLGLPFIRTSPDHGTANDIAGKWIANPKSTIESIKLAVQMLG
ncbi:MAG: 4-hydroxythreonine-4-phosphate dehydrogenase PdxA [Chlamydiota bacterium]|nr:4-hydroxythreonine-4-phosphate dehydrogenase PdxA [Chlamydiota bacterium]